MLPQSASRELVVTPRRPRAARGPGEQALGFGRARRERHQRAVAEVELDALAPPRRAAAAGRSPRRPSRPRPPAGDEATPPHRPASCACARPGPSWPARASPSAWRRAWASPRRRARAGSSSGRRRRARGRLRPGRRRDHAVAVGDEEDDAVPQRGVELDERLGVRPGFLGRLSSSSAGPASRPGALVVEGRATTVALAVERRRRPRSGSRSRSAPRALRRLGHRADASTAHTPRMRLPQPFRKFFADRGPHLAAMIAYFALLSFVPLLFLTVVAARPRRPARRVELPGHGAEARLPGQLGREHRAHGRRDPEARDGARDRRRRRADLGVALALQRARVGDEHRLRPAEPLVPARQAARRRADAALARDAVRRPARRLVRRSTCSSATRPGSPATRTSPTGSRSRSRSLGVFVFLVAIYYFLTNVEHSFARRPARRRLRGGRARGELPGAAALRALLEQRGRAEGVRRAGAAARLALRDGERDRLRRGGELVASRPPPPGPKRPPAWPDLGEGAAQR